LPEDDKTIAELVQNRERLMNRLDERGACDSTQGQPLAHIEDLNWKIAHSSASDITEVLSKAKLLADVSGAIYPHTIEGALLKSLIDDLTRLSN